MASAPALMPGACGEAGGQADGQSTALSYRTVEVDGRPVRFVAVGSGPPALFLHGWGLRPNAYAKALRAMASVGCRVLAPALPGFGGTGELDASERSFDGYGRWVGRFADAALGRKGVRFALVAGHSFGGGVAAAFAFGQPRRCRSLLLVNAVGSPAWVSLPCTERTMLERPLWDWGRHFGTDLLHSPGAARLLFCMLGDVVPNLVSNPLGLLRTAEVIRRADLVSEVAAVADRGTPVVVVWSDRDRLVPRSAFDQLRRAARSAGLVVDGSHAWLIADPERFAEVAVVAFTESGASVARPQLRAVGRPARSCHIHVDGSVHK